MGSSVEQARARRRKAAEAQAAKERAMWNKAKKPLLCVVIALAVIGLGILLFNAISNSINAVSVKNNALVNVQEDWIVTNLSKTSTPKYYHLANVIAPKGYTLDPTYTLDTNSLNQARYYRADDEGALIKSVYVTGVANKTPADMISRLRSNGLFTSVGDEQHTTVNGTDVVYFLGITSAYDGTGTQIEGVVTATLYAYLPCSRGSSIGVSLITVNLPEAEVPAAETMLPLLTETVSGITLMK